MAVQWGRVSKLMMQPQRHPRSGVFRLRKGVPKDLRKRVAFLLGRDGEVSELIRSLGTHDPQEAKRLMPDATRWADDILAAARNGAAPLSNRQAHALAGIWYQRALAEWEINPSLAAQWEGWEDTIPIAGDDLTGGDTDHDTFDPAWEKEWAAFLRPFVPMAQTALEAEGIITDTGGTQRLARLISSRLLQALMEHRKRQSGDYRPDPRPATFPALERGQNRLKECAEASVSLRALYEGWKATATAKARSKEEARYVVELLANFVGHDDAKRIDADALRGWRDVMVAEGKRNNTWNNRLSSIRAVLAWGVSEGRLKFNVADGLRLKKNRVQSPLPYSDAEAAQILLAARKETRPSLRWAHWIMAFTGMRAGEVLQLTAGDVRQEGEIWYLAVHEDDASKSVKTGQRRNVPIHPGLFAEGFVSYAQTVAGDGPLFPDKRLDKFGNRGGRAWNVIGLWVRRSVGITDPLKAPDHSWRHRIEDELRAAEVPEDARDAITGHARKTTGRQYGVRGENLKRLSRYLARVPMPPGAEITEAPICAR